LSSFFYILNKINTKTIFQAQRSLQQEKTYMPATDQDILTIADYYPFGLEMKGLVLNSGNYRFANKGSLPKRISRQGTASSRHASLMPGLVDG
jgi:hypothetical protein